MGIKNKNKKEKLAVKGRQARWAPVWALLRKFGTGSARYHHVSEITKDKRTWRRGKLHVKPRKQKKSHLG